MRATRSARLWRRRARDWLGREKPADYFQSFQGAHKAMVYEHIPWGVVLDENVSPETLRRLPVVLLPNAAILAEKEIALFRRYVEDGGRLVVTGQSGQFDRLGRPLADPALSELIGARVKGRLDSLDNWMRFARAQTATGDQPLALSARPDWPFLVLGPATIYEPTTARTAGELLKPHRTTRQREGREGTAWPMSADTPVGPAILVNALGRGTVLTFAGSPDFATASEHHIVEARKLLAEAVRALHPRPRLRITAPANVEAVVTDDPAARTLRVHLLAYNAPPQTTPAKERPYVLPGLIEDAPMYRVSFTFAEPVKQAAALARTTTVQRRGRTLEATVADLHEVIVVRY